MLLLLFPVVLAENSGSEENSFTDFISGTAGELQREGEAFIETGETAAGGAASGSLQIFDAFGTGSCGPSQSWNPSDPATIVGTWLIPSFFVVILVSFGITLVYMAGQLLNLPNLVAQAKEEGFQTLLTAIRVVFVILLVWASNMWYTISVPASVASDDLVYAEAGAHSMIDGASAVSRFMVVEMVNSYTMLLLYNMLIHTLYSSTMWVGITWRAMYSFNLGPVLKPLIDIIGMALQFLSLGIGEWMMHIVLLCMIKKWMWSIFIPLSLLLRALPHTRGAGEALFALGVSLAVVYPFMFLFDYEVHLLLSENLVNSEDALTSFVQSSGIIGVAASVVVIMFLMAGAFIPFFLGGALNLAFELVKNAVYYVAIMSFFLPFINVFITLTAAREVAKVFNVDVNFMSFLKII
jgi:hypothetical protein